MNDENQKVYHIKSPAPEPRITLMIVRRPLTCGSGGRLSLYMKPHIPVLGNCND